MPSIQAFRRELDAFLDEALSVEGRKEIFVGIARDEISKFEADWRSALKADPTIEVFVDGQLGAPLEAVTIPGGFIAARVTPLGPVVDRAVELFDLFTKVVTGGFKAETVAFVNDVRTPIRSIDETAGDQVAITNLAPFARKGEVQGFTDTDSSGFRNGLFEGVAAVLKREIRGTPIPVKYIWRSFGGDRLPAILIG